MKLLKFETSTCAPCRMMAPIVESVTRELNFPVEKVNAASDPRAKVYGVTAVPTLILLDDAGRELARHTGVMPLPRLREWLQKWD